MFWSLLGYIVTKACTSPRNSTWFTRPFLLVRGLGLGTRLAPHKLHAAGGNPWIVFVNTFHNLGEIHEKAQKEAEEEFEDAQRAFQHQLAQQVQQFEQEREEREQRVQEQIRMQEQEMQQEVEELRNSKKEVENQLREEKRDLEQRAQKSEACLLKIEALKNQGTTVKFHN